MEELMKHKILMLAGLLTLSACMKLKKKDEDSLKLPIQNQVQAQEIKVEKPFINERT